MVIVCRCQNMTTHASVIFCDSIMSSGYLWSTEKVYNVGEASQLSGIKVYGNMRPLQQSQVSGSGKKPSGRRRTVYNDGYQDLPEIIGLACQCYNITSCRSLTSYRIILSCRSKTSC